MRTGSGRGHRIEKQAGVPSAARGRSEAAAAGYLQGRTDSGVETRNPTGGRPAADLAMVQEECRSQADRDAHQRFSSVPVVTGPHRCARYESLWYLRRETRTVRLTL